MNGSIRKRQKTLKEAVLNFIKLPQKYIMLDFIIKYDNKNHFL